MNTIITCHAANVAARILTFCIHHKVDAVLKHTSGLQVIHLNLVNPFLVTKIQDDLLRQFPAHAWNMNHAVVADY
jgi:hypothetical protein